MIRAALLAEFPSRTSWNTRFQELTTYKQLHGHCSVPKANGALGRWVARQRELAKKNLLPADRRVRLEALGFVWNTNDEAWETRYRQLLLWTHSHGHACVPIAEGDLGLWVAKQRQMNRKGKLATERKALLDQVNFTWDTPSADWNEKYADLVRYKDIHGDCRVPFNSPDGLGWWVNTQRQARRKSKLSRERQERLDAIGFIWNPQQHTFRAATRRRTDDQNIPQQQQHQHQQQPSDTPLLLPQSHPHPQPNPQPSSSFATTTAVLGPPIHRMTKRFRSFPGPEDPSPIFHPPDSAPSAAASDLDFGGSCGSSKHPLFSDRPTTCLGSNFSPNIRNGHMPMVSHSYSSAHDHRNSNMTGSKSATRRATSLGMFTPPCPSSTASPTFVSGTSTPTGGDSYGNIPSAAGRPLRTSEWDSNGVIHGTGSDLMAGQRNVHADEAIAGSSGTLTFPGSCDTLNRERCNGTLFEGGSSGVLTIGGASSAVDIGDGASSMHAAGSCGSISVSRSKPFPMEVCSPAQSSSPVNSMGVMTVLPPLKIPNSDGLSLGSLTCASGMSAVAGACPPRDLQNLGIPENAVGQVADMPRLFNGPDHPQQASTSPTSFLVSPSLNRNRLRLDEIVHPSEEQVEPRAAIPPLSARKPSSVFPAPLGVSVGRPHAPALPPFWCLGDGMVSNSPRRRRRSQLVDDRRAMSFSCTALENGGNPAIGASSDRSTSLEPRRPTFSSVPSADEKLQNTGVGAAGHPRKERSTIALADLMTPSVSPEVIAAQTRMGYKLPSIQEMCEQDLARSDVENALQLRRLDKFG